MNNKMVAHRWAHKQSAQGSNYRSDGTILWSYSTPIARHLDNDIVLLSTDRYSTSTQRHQSYANGAASHLTRLFVSRVEREPSKEWALEEIEKLLRASEMLQIKAARSQKFGSYLLRDADEKYQTAVTLAKVFKIRKNLDKWAVKLTKDLAAEKEAAKKALVKRREVLLQAIARWKANEPEVSLDHHYGQEVFLRRTGDNVETSKGVTIPHSVFARYVQRYKETQEIPDKVLSFNVTKVDDKHVVIGCHDISWEEIESVL